MSESVLPCVRVHSVPRLHVLAACTDACVGTAATGSFSLPCRDNSYGPLCQLCLPGYVPQGDQCVACDPSTAQGPLITLTTAGVCVVAICGACLVTVGVLLCYQIATDTDVLVTPGELKRVSLAMWAALRRRCVACRGHRCCGGVACGCGGCRGVVNRCCRRDGSSSSPPSPSVVVVSNPTPRPAPQSPKRYVPLAVTAGKWSSRRTSVYLPADGASFVPANPWRTKFKIAISFYQVGVPALP